ncbi:hypothetical protein EXN66_Car004243 [Channa argus]|uniref:Uncharacterized protein n=1 Tax=Channa argus TaxID=215402 RepID=A0A6G1PE41_CHAAH|nr:hypothetical protein EXN66_Car004243 [Channa argus]
MDKLHSSPMESELLFTQLFQNTVHIINYSTSFSSHVPKLVFTASLSSSLVVIDSTYLRSALENTAEPDCSPVAHSNLPCSRLHHQHPLLPELPK